MRSFARHWSGPIELRGLARPHLSHRRLREQQRLGKGARSEGQTFCSNSISICCSLLGPNNSAASERFWVCPYKPDGEPNRNISLDNGMLCEIKDEVPREFSMDRCAVDRRKLSEC
jgi:hypothetical protein